MPLVDRGSGPPLVIVPGLQGRWEWMAPLVDALARDFRVVTFSLCDEPSSGFPCDPSRGIATYLDQIALAFERAGIDNAVLAGVSFGGPLAAEFALRHPDRVRALVLISALPIDWQPDARARFYMRAPRLLSPVFFVDAPLRALPELHAALPSLAARARFGAGQTVRLLRHVISPARMARRVRWLRQFAFGDLSGLRRPVLVVTGEAGLDRVVPPELTRRYLSAIPHARHVTVPRTGHLGVVTRPHETAAAIRAFVESCSADVWRASA